MRIGPRRGESFAPSCRNAASTAKTATPPYSSVRGCLLRPRTDSDRRHLQLPCRPLQAMREGTNVIGFSAFLRSCLLDASSEPFPSSPAALGPLCCASLSPHSHFRLKPSSLDPLRPTLRLLLLERHSSFPLVVVTFHTRHASSRSCSRLTDASSCRSANCETRGRCHCQVCERGDQGQRLDGVLHNLYLSLNTSGLRGLEILLTDRAECGVSNRERAVGYEIVCSGRPALVFRSRKKRQSQQERPCR